VSSPIVVGYGIARGSKAALAGNSMARGRNGWFVPREVTVLLRTASMSPEFGQDIAVELESNRQYRDIAPIHLDLTVDDARAIRDALTEVLGG
jgi:hypothetical protein